jgi:hypothetical protein
MGERDRNDHGRYADGIDPETVLEVFDARDDLARPVTAVDVVDELDIARRTAHNKLNRLVERGVLDTRKIGARGRVWWRPTPADAESGRERGETPTQRNDSANHGTRDETEQDAAAAGDGATGLAAVEFPQTAAREACEAAVRAARDYIRDHDGATKAELVRDVMPEHPLGYDVDAALAKVDSGERYRGAWWRRVVKPGFEALDDVEKPSRGGSIWTYAGE